MNSPAPKFSSDYGKLTDLNRHRVILDAVGEAELASIAADYLELLGTSSAVYEANGDYALGIFTSGWCRFLDHASRRLCGCQDNAQALASGQWLCHESCWADASLPAMQGVQPVDVACRGGRRIYAAPIRAGGKVVGAINFAYGQPPQDHESLARIASLYRVDPERLASLAQEQPPLPPETLANAKRRLDTSARLIGALVERHQAEEAHQKSAAQLNLIADTLPAFIAYLGADDLRYRFVNRQFAQAVGLPRERIVGQSVSQVLGPEDARLVMSHLETVRRGQSVSYENRFTLPSGPRWIQVTHTPVRDREGPVEGIVVLGLDITQRKQTEQDLHQSEERFRALVNSMTELTALHEVIYDQTGQPVDYRILDCNPAFTKITGIPRQQAVGALATELYGTDQAPFLEVYAQTAQSGRPTDFETYFPPMDKHFHISVFSPGQGRFATIASDISERKKAEQERERLETQLRQAQKMEAVGTLAGGIAHDFNNILAAITGYAELALEDSRFARTNPEDLEQILKATEKARDLVLGILTFSRKTAIQLSALDLNREINQAAKMLERTIPRMVGIQLHLTPDPAPIRADPAQIQQLLLNLGSNASQAMPHGGRLIVETENLTVDQAYCRVHSGLAPGLYVQLSVSDTGHGMDPATQEHIFEPFFTTKEVGSGTGLGLAMVYGIVKSHLGHITCYSQPGQGTTFKILFPALEPGQSLSATRAPSASPSPGGRETILVVDDDQALRNLGEKILGRAGYRIFQAGNGEEALETFRSHAKAIDLVLLDIGMPGMGGHRCLEQLLVLDPQVRVIIASGYSKTETVDRAFASGAWGYVAKPFRKADLLKAVRRVLDAPAGQNPPPRPASP